MKLRLLTALTVLLAAFLIVTPVFAAQGHVYGVVFVDSNLNGVWDVGEKGLGDIAVTLESADGKTSIGLTSAPIADEINKTAANVCDYLDADAPTPCPGTWGLIPAGDVGWWWKVSIKAPAGYYVTSANPQWVSVQALGSTKVVQFGVAPVGAGGPVGPVLLPATGAGYELLAAGVLLIAGLGLTMKSRLRR